jgi:hypothetical protein
VDFKKFREKGERQEKQEVLIKAGEEELHNKLAAEVLKRVPDQVVDYMQYQTSLATNLFPK